MDYYKESLKMHEEYRGKMEVASKVPVKNKDDLSTAYTPGVAEPCRKINENPEDVYKYTNKSNTVAVISDGSAVLGLGNIGGLASIPVMDGKSLLFKEFAGIDAIPICLETQDVEEIVMIAKNIAPTLGGINLEDIAAPRCFEIEKKLQEQVDIPVFHDDQHGTAVVVTAAIFNSLKIVGKKMEDLKVVISGAGAAGAAFCTGSESIGVLAFYEIQKTCLPGHLRKRKKSVLRRSFLTILQVDYLAAAASSLSISVVETILTLPLDIRTLG